MRISAPVHHPYLTAIRAMWSPARLDLPTTVNRPLREPLDLMPSGSPSARAGLPHFHRVGPCGVSLRAAANPLTASRWMTGQVDRFPAEVSHVSQISWLTHRMATQSATLSWCMGATSHAVRPVNRERGWGTLGNTDNDRREFQLRFRFWWRIGVGAAFVAGAIYFAIDRIFFATLVCLAFAAVWIWAAIRSGSLLARLRGHSAGEDRRLDG